jgi:hypothetical protein
MSFFFFESEGQERVAAIAGFFVQEAGMSLLGRKGCFGPKEFWAQECWWAGLLDGSPG